MAGVIHVVCGPMFAGKTSALIRRVAAWESSGGRACVVKPAWDGRYGADGGGTGAPHVVTHDGARLIATAARDAMDVARVADEAMTRAPHADAAGWLIAVDEAHFFGAGLTSVVRAKVRTGASVLVCGVELDHRGEPFEPFPTLLAQADEVVKLASRCAKCGGPARHSQRMNASAERIVVGGAEMYEARCRECFEPGT